MNTGIIRNTYCDPASIETNYLQKDYQQDIHDAVISTGEDDDSCCAATIVGNDENEETQACDTSCNPKRRPGSSTKCQEANIPCHCCQEEETTSFRCGGCDQLKCQECEDGLDNFWDCHFCERAFCFSRQCYKQEFHMVPVSTPQLSCKSCWKEHPEWQERADEEADKNNMMCLVQASKAE